MRAQPIKNGPFTIVKQTNTQWKVTLDNSQTINQNDKINFIIEINNQTFEIIHQVSDIPTNNKQQFMLDILTNFNNDPNNSNQFIVTYDAVTDDNSLLISSNSLLLLMLILKD